MLRYILPGIRPSGIDLNVQHFFSEMSSPGRRSKSNRLQKKKMARTGSFKASKFNKWDPKGMEKALEWYNNTRAEANAPSVRMIARRWYVPRTTLRDRISGKTTLVSQLLHRQEENPCLAKKWKPN